MSIFFFWRPFRALIYSKVTQFLCTSWNVEHIDSVCHFLLLLLLLLLLCISKRYIPSLFPTISGLIQNPTFRCSFPFNMRRKYTRYPIENSCSSDFLMEKYEECFSLTSPMTYIPFKCISHQLSLLSGCRWKKKSLLFSWSCVFAMFGLEGVLKNILQV